jgi:hypothetical protein
MPSIAAIAEGLGIDRRLAARYAKRGMPLSSVKAAGEWKVKNVRPRVTPGGAKAAAAAGGEYADARRRLAVAEAREHELRLLLLEGTLVRRDVMRAELARRLSGLREALLQLPSRLRSVLAAETDEGKVHNLLEDELHAVLAQVASVG